MKKDASLLKIGELAKASNTNVSTLKFYVKEGLIQAACKTGPNMAYYHAESVARVQLIKTLQKEHYYPLSAIKRMLDQYNLNQNPVEIELLDAIHKVDYTNSSKTFSLSETAKMCRLNKDQIVQLTESKLVKPDIVGKRFFYTDEDLRIMLLLRRRMDAGIPFEESVEAFLIYEKALRAAAKADVDAFINRALMAARPSAKDAVRMIFVSDETLDAFISLKRAELNREFGSERVNDLYRFSANLSILLQDIGKAFKTLKLGDLAVRCGDAASVCPEGEDRLSTALKYYSIMINGLTGDLAQSVSQSSQAHSFFISLNTEAIQGPETLLLYCLRLGWLALAPTLLSCGTEAQEAFQGFQAFASACIGPKADAFCGQITASIKQLGGSL